MNLKFWTWGRPTDLSASPGPDAFRDPGQGQNTSGQFPTEGQQDKFAGFNGVITVGTDSGADEPVRPSNESLVTWRKMRRNPTIALARAILTAPIRSSEFTIETKETAPAESQEMANDMVEKLWRRVINDMTYSLDYGFQSFEKVFALQDDNFLTVKKLKMLIPEATEVVVDESTGGFRGALNGKGVGNKFQASIANKVFLPPEKVFWYANEREADDWYGTSFMERARPAWNKWREIDRKYDRYLTQVAGPIPQVQFPEGESLDPSNQKVSNVQIAATLLRNLQACHGVAVPNQMQRYIQGMIDNNIDPSKFQAWKIDFLENKGNYGPEFTDGLTREEIQMLRSYLVPERAATEGEHGTKAEAEEHGDLILVSADLILMDFVDCFNKWVIDPWLVLNWGESAKGTLKVNVQKLNKDLLELHTALVTSLFGAPLNVDIFSEIANVEAIFEMLGIPLRSEEERNRETDEQAVRRQEELDEQEAAEREAARTLEENQRREQIEADRNIIVNSVNDIVIEEINTLKKEIEDQNRTNPSDLSNLVDVIKDRMPKNGGNGDTDDLIEVGEAAIIGGILHRKTEDGFKVVEDESETD